MEDVVGHYSEYDKAALGRPEVRILMSKPPQ